MAYPVDKHAVVLALDRIKMRGDETWYDYYHKALDAIAKLPPVDAVPVVRCKDCNAYQGVYEWCQLYGTDMKPMDFCSYGERKNAAD